ncbi:MAG: toxin VasX, partial [Thiobacillaceae bacterium]
IITIRNPRHATKVWIGFSDVQWTDAVLSQHDDAAVRQRHMTCITVSGGKVDAQAHTAPIEQVGQWLPEFQMAAQTGQQRFGPWCPHAFNSRHAGMQAFLQAVQKARPQGGAAIVALHDPVGLAMEIAALAEARKLIYMSRPDVEKPHFAASAIVNLEQQLKEQAKLNEIIAGEAL